MAKRAGSTHLPSLTIYRREYCHLCDEMIAGLRALQEGWRFTLEIMDVDSDPELESRYGELVPVLIADGQEICHYHLDPAALDAYFGRFR